MKPTPDEQEIVTVEQEIVTVSDRRIGNTSPPNGGQSSVLNVKCKGSVKEKQGKQARKWCFTLNNYSRQEIVTIVTMLDLHTRKYVFQEETGENGTKHLQGCCWLKKLYRLTGLKKLISDRAHFEKCNNWTASVEYCRKEETRTGGIYSKGFPRPIKVLKEDQLYDWQKDIVAELKKEPDDRKIYWFYETTGNVGKSTFCKYLVVKHKAIILGGKANDMKHGIVNYVNKHGEYPRTIVIDIPRTSRNFLSYQGIEEIKNACFFSGKYDGDMVVGNCPHLVIFANFRPDVDKCSADRWEIKCLGDDDESDDSSC